MPDPNKFEALRSARFQVRSVCSYCVFFRVGNRAAWGVCTKIPYEHQKHTGPKRAASVPATGFCPEFEAHQPDIEAHLGAHIEFFEDDS